MLQQLKTRGISWSVCFDGTQSLGNLLVDLMVKSPKASECPSCLGNLSQVGYEATCSQKSPHKQQRSGYTPETKHDNEKAAI